MNDIPVRPYVQGTGRSLALLSSEQPATGAAGLLLLRRAGEPVAEAVEKLIRRIIRLRWEKRGGPASLTLVPDSTVVLRYGDKQTGAETGYNPRKPGRPSHHLIVAFAQETG